MVKQPDGIAVIPERDARSCRMLHVLILSLLRKINASSRERLLDLVLKWRLSAPTVLATWTMVGMG